MTHRLGIFATTDGWVVADPKQKRIYDSRPDAMDAARRLANVARWRGAEVELLAQDLPGGPLALVKDSQADAHRAPAGHGSGRTYQPRRGPNTLTTRSRARSGGKGAGDMSRR